jgi:protocatechuate 3,4-dioxygenase beta subunit
MKLNFSRRNFLRTLLAAPVSYILTACGIQTASPTAAPTASSLPAQPTATAAIAVQPEPTAVAATNAPTTAPATAVSQLLAPTPACGDDDDDDLTLSQTEGPYYTPDTPQRTSLLEPGMPGTKMIVTGYVLDTQCQPVPNALIDFWHANNAGEYDNVGYTLRGHQFTDANGLYTLETIMPGIYPGRTRHFHVKVQAPNQPVLTTQLYFPGEPSNDNDGIYNAALLMDVQDTNDGKLGNFNFVVTVS